MEIEGLEIGCVGWIRIGICLCYTQGIFDMIGKVRGIGGCSKGLFVRLYCIWIGVYLRVSRQSTYPSKQTSTHLISIPTIPSPSRPNPSRPDTAKMDRHLHVPQQSRQTIHFQPDDSSPSISTHSARYRSRRKNTKNRNPRIASTLPPLPPSLAQRLPNAGP